MYLKHRERNAIMHMRLRPPRIVCLCGSTRFPEAFQQATLSETLAGHIVVSIGCNLKSDAQLFQELGISTEYDFETLKTFLDELHKRKIDISDEILVLNVNGYIGDSTRSEIAYAQGHGKTIRYLEAPSPSWRDLQ